MPYETVATSAPGSPSLFPIEEQAIFQPLHQRDSIRILELNRINPAQQELQGRLIYTRLSANPDYSALSYAWGNGPPTKSIIMSGNVPYPVTENLFSALQELLGSEKIFLWVDQICIDQGNESEKEHQICLMGQIYRQARQVIAWLGGSTPNISTAVRFLRFLAESKAPKLDGGSDSCQSDVSISIQDLKSMSMDSPEKIFDISNPVWQSAIYLAERPWFSRLWVVQEAVLSRDLQFRCGECIISANEFFKAVKAILQIATIPNKPVFAALENAQTISTIRANYLSKCKSSYLELANQLSRWDCKDDRDRLHSIKGMVHQDTEWFMPSYTLTSEELFEDFARRYIFKTKSLNILHLAGDSRIYVLRDKISSYNCVPFERPFKICSWAPDWRIKTRPKPLHLTFETNSTLESASLSETENCFDQSSKLLRVQARMVDGVAWVGLPLIEGIHPGLSLDAVLHTWFKAVKEAFPGTNDIEERFAALLVMNDIKRASSDSAHGSGSDQFLANFKRWASALFMDVDKPRDLSEAAWIDLQQNPIQDGIDAVVLYGREVMEVCRYRSFFITNCGRLGLGPAQVSKLSSVYLIRGLATPFLLQKAPEGDDYYYLRGECYVEGLMDRMNGTSNNDGPIYLI